MYDWLLFLHVFSAAALVATTVMFSAYVLGAPVERRSLGLANALWAIGGLGTLVFGVWLAIDVDGYEVWDGWILLAIVLWALASETGRRAQLVADAGVSADGAAVVAFDSQAALMHWLRAGFVVALLVVMIWKPGA
jgi:hypothetical protein